MRKAILVLALILAGCSKQVPGAGSEHAAEDLHVVDGNSSDGSGPDIAPSLVPGVALNYAYAFTLPVERVADVQEKHATQCEALGPAKCRITGMEYHAGHGQITATLSLKLAPDIARGFGKQGIATVVQNGGMLSDAEIDSTDAGTTIANADRDASSLANEKKEIDRRLAEPGLSATERTQLEQRSQSLIDAQRQAGAVRADAALLLASTPMKFAYSSGPVDTGFHDGPVVRALKDGWADLEYGVLVILTVLIALIPWIVLATLAALLWRWASRKFGRTADLD
jgi:hypothetical protein